MDKANRIVFGALLLAAFSFAVLTIAQDKSGFISLDCSQPQNNYTDDVTGITYISDSSLIDTGESKAIMASLKTSSISKQLYYVRSFPDGVKHCYTVSATGGKRYLVRAQFMYGDYDSKNQLPEFHLYLGVTFWASIKFKDTSEFNSSRRISPMNGNSWINKVIVPQYLYTGTILSISPTTASQFNFSIYAVNNSTYPPLLNAIEAYVAIDILEFLTKKEDAYAITNIKSTYGLKLNWQGDPCGPETLLDLSYNNLTGQIPDSLAQLSQLKALNLTGNNLTGYIPPELLKRDNSGTIQLHLDGNPHLCKTMECNTDTKKNSSKLPVALGASAGALLIILVALGCYCYAVNRRRLKPQERSANSLRWDQRIQIAADAAQAIIDPGLAGNFNENSAWKIVELAKACVAQESTGRPSMSRVAMELEQCLAGTKTPGSELDSGIDMNSVNLTSAFGPRARSEQLPSEQSLTLGETDERPSKPDQPRIRANKSFKLHRRDFSKGGEMMGDKASVPSAVAMLLLAVASTLAVLAGAQDQSGFKSIDCGQPQSNYTDDATTISYISDSSLIDTGVPVSISASLRSNSLSKQLYYVRSFPDGLKNCYTVAATRGKRYLIRARFMYGNYDSKNQPPQFDLYLGVTYWASIKFKYASDVVDKEIIHVLSSDSIDLCLVKAGSTTPFISAIELRPISPKTDIYVTTSGSLLSYFRIDLGSQTSNIIYRYRDDVFDRLWFPFANQIEIQPSWKTTSTNLPIGYDDGNDYFPPSIVMETAVTPSDPTQPLNISWTPEDPKSGFYIYLHYAEVQQLKSNESRNFMLSLNGVVMTKVGAVAPKYLYAGLLYSTGAAVSFSPQFNFSFYEVNGSTLPPLLNAIEAYVVKDIQEYRTKQDDADSMRQIKSAYGLKLNWQGDPCGPETLEWDGVRCISDNPNISSISYLNLSSHGLTGKITSGISNLKSLQTLDLSYNKLTEQIPDSLAQLSQLKVLNLSGNNLTGYVPVELLKKASSGTIQLSLDGNPNLCETVECKPITQNNKKSNKLGIALGVTGGALVIILLVALGCFCYVIPMRRSQTRGEDTVYELTNISSDFRSCVAQESNARPTMSKVVMELEQCLGEIRTPGTNEFDSSIEMSSVNLSSAFGPRSPSGHERTCRSEKKNRGRSLAVNIDYLLSGANKKMLAANFLIEYKLKKPINSDQKLANSDIS
ncbi:hypothetical protein SAY86_025840 [Trapa natans]|uniref:Malectin-like domain-containing protein n=1 Tax=Trapa natans TaxID=22666 RepID=A0AAN7QGY7_TRANT|nr:hypothetical protein SAY86_025840 [Trapa natans]